jgi:hypothetical protein
MNDLRGIGKLDELGQPTQQIIERRRRAEFITPIPKPRKRKGSAKQEEIVFDKGKGFQRKTSRMTRLRSSMNFGSMWTDGGN